MHKWVLGAVLAACLPGVAAAYDCQRKARVGILLTDIELLSADGTSKLGLIRADDFRAIRKLSFVYDCRDKWALIGHKDHGKVLIPRKSVDYDIPEGVKTVNCSKTGYEGANC